ncbi:MAG: hypothetical protein GXO91_09495 [FCB group bacterium]|nr:hypothetical protein [FCB group bacterium]
MPRLLLPLKSYKTWLFIGYALLVLFISSLEASQLPKVRFLMHNDKIVHFFEYLIFGFLLINAMENGDKSFKIRLAALLIIFIFPIFDEILQSFVPGRFPEFLDGITDIIGGSFGYIIFIQMKNVKITSR